MKNTHSRVLGHPIESVRPWIERAWSGTANDIFPRDHIRSWRRNLPHAPNDTLVVGATKLGHGPFVFTLTQWDGAVWRVDLPRGAGWHGFVLESKGDRTQITHTLDAELGLGFRLFVLPIHNWAVEAMFDRLEVALSTGAVPQRTSRPLPLFAGTVLGVMRMVRGSARSDKFSECKEVS